MGTNLHRRDSIGAALLGLSLKVTATTAASAEVSQVARMYALDFVGTAATGYGLNDAGDVVGKSYTDPGCGPFCLPPEEIVVWRGGNRIVLPLVPGFSIYQGMLALTLGTEDAAGPLKNAAVISLAIAGGVAVGLALGRNVFSLATWLGSHTPSAGSDRDAGTPTEAAGSGGGAGPPG